MSFFQPQTAGGASTSYAGITEDNLSTPQEAISVPWFCGWGRFKAIWISDSAHLYNAEARAAQINTKGDFGDPIYAAIIAAFASGPVDKCGGWWAQNRFYYANVTRSGRYHTFAGASINDGRFVADQDNDGDIRLHWGVDDAVQADHLTVTIDAQAKTQAQLWGTGTDHPPYRRICYAEFGGLFHGINGTKPINVEAKLGRSPVLPAAFAGIDTTLFGYGVNPVAALLEVLTDPLQGLGWDAARFNVATWESVADAILAYDYISPSATAGTDWKDVVNDLLTYFDGYIYQDENGLYCLGYRPAESSPTALATISLNEMTDEPKLSVEAPDDAPTEVALVYTDETHYKETSLALANPVARLARGQDTSETINRPWINNTTAAMKYLNRYLSALWGSELKGTLRVRRDKAVTDGTGRALRPGDIIALDYAPAQLDQLCRIKRVRHKFASPEVELEIVSERGSYPTPYVPPISDRLSGPVISVGTLVQPRLYAGPMVSEGILEVLPLAGRADAQTLAADLWLGRFTTSYGTAPVVRLAVANFALVCTLDADLTSGATTATITPADQDLEILQAVSSDEQDNDTLLLIVEDEIMSIGTVTPGAGSEYTVSLLRGRQGSTAAAHDTSGGASPIDCHVIARENLLRISNQLGLLDTLSKGCHGKLQAIGLNDVQDLAAATDMIWTTPGAVISFSSESWDDERLAFTINAGVPDIPGTVLIVRQRYQPPGGSYGEWSEIATYPQGTSSIEVILNRSGSWQIDLQLGSGTWRGPLMGARTRAYTVPTITNFAAAQSGFNRVVTWDADEALHRVEIDETTSSPWPTTGNRIYVANIWDESYTIPGGSTGVTSIFRARGVDRYGNVSAWVEDSVTYYSPT